MYSIEQLDLNWKLLFLKTNIYFKYSIFKIKNYIIYIFVFIERIIYRIIIIEYKA